MQTPPHSQAPSQAAHQSATECVLALVLHSWGKWVPGKLVGCNHEITGQGQVCPERREGMDLPFKMSLHTKIAKHVAKNNTKNEANQITNWKMDLLNTKLK